MGSNLSRFRAFVFVSLVAFLSITSTPAVLGERLFELGDGTGRPGTADIAGSAVQPGCDWAELFDATPTPDEFNAAARRCGGVGAAFVSDQRAQGSGTVDDTIFTTGSSKNDSPVSSWQWTSGTVPAKDDVSNAYAFAALNAQNELIVYMGLERLAPTGDSHVDFEFNQSPVTLDKSAPCGSDGSAGPSDGPPCEWVGDRTVGDLLVVMDFRKGGAIGFLEIRRWNGAVYDLVETVGGEGCDGTDTVCAFNNATAIDGGPWPNYDSKGKVIATLDQNAFTEVGVNVTRLLGSTPCFVELRAKTRSSSSYSSTLKDFVLGGFDICSLEIDKSGSPDQPRPDLSKHGDPFTYRYTISNTGAGTLYLVSVIDSQLGDITDIARNGGEFTPAAAVAGGGSACGTLQAGSSCSFDITRAVPDDADDPFQTSVSSSYSTSPTMFAAGAGRTIITVTDSDTFPLNLFQPSVDVTKSGDLYGTPGEAAHYTIDVVNTSSSDSPPLVHASITDTLLGNLLDPANPYVTSRTCTDVLPVGGSCRIEAARVVLPTDPDPLPNTATATYNPQDFPNVITDSDNHAVDIVHPSFSLTVAASPDRGYVGDVIDYSYSIANTGDDVLTRVSVVDTVLGDLTSSFPASLAPGASAVVTVQRAIQASDPDPIQNQVTATYQAAGLLTQVSRTAVTVIDRLIPCAKSPGFWKGGEGTPKWDNPADPIAVKAGFYTNTLFPWLDPSLAGTTYLGVLNLNAQGDVTRQLGFKYVAARLNEAAFGVTQAVADLLDQIDVYLAAHPVGSNPQGDAATQGQSLLGSLNNYFTSVGETQCPPTDQF